MTSRNCTVSGLFPVQILKQMNVRKRPRQEITGDIQSLPFSSTLEPALGTTESDIPKPIPKSDALQSALQPTRK